MLPFSHIYFEVFVIYGITIMITWNPLLAVNPSRVERDALLSILRANTISGYPYLSSPYLPTYPFYPLYRGVYPYYPTVIPGYPY